MDVQVKVTIQEAFQPSALRCTSQRYAVLHYLLRYHNHPLGRSAGGGLPHRLSLASLQYDIRTGIYHFPRNVCLSDYPALQVQLSPLPTYRVELRGLKYG
jgi:hypothetical protein